MRATAHGRDLGPPAQDVRDDPEPAWLGQAIRIDHRNEVGAGLARSKVLQLRGPDLGRVDDRHVGTQRGKIGGRRVSMTLVLDEHHLEGLGKILLLERAQHAANRAPGARSIVVVVGDHHDAQRHSHESKLAERSWGPVEKSSAQWRAECPAWLQREGPMKPHTYTKEARQGATNEALAPFKPPRRSRAGAPARQ